MLRPFLRLNPPHPVARVLLCTRLTSSLFKAVDAGEEELGNGDLALLVRRFPAVNDLTVRYASRLTSGYEVLSQVR